MLERAKQAEQARARRIRKFITSNSREKGASPRTVSIDAAGLRWAIEHAPPNSAIGIYLLTENRLRLLIATRNGQSEVIVPVDAKALQRDIGRFLEQIESARRHRRFSPRPLRKTRTTARRSGSKERR